MFRDEETMPRCGRHVSLGFGHDQQARRCNAPMELFWYAELRHGFVVEANTSSCERILRHSERPRVVTGCACHGAAGAY